MRVIFKLMYILPYPKYGSIFNDARFISYIYSNILPITVQEYRSMVRKL